MIDEATGPEEFAQSAEENKTVARKHNNDESVEAFFPFVVDRVQPSLL